VSGAETAASQNIATACSARPATISGREPIRSLSSPAIGAMIIGMPVQGSVRRPASKGAIREQPDVRHAHRREHRRAGRARIGGRVGERPQDAGVAALDEGQEELGLGRKQAKRIRLRDPGGLGDLHRRRAVQTPCREHALGGLEDLLAALLGGGQCASGGHGQV